MDLSSPENESVNSDINKVVASLAYTSVDHMEALLVSTTRGRSLQKRSSAPRRSVFAWVHREDTQCADKVLPFELRLAQTYFQHWLMHYYRFFTHNGISKSLHYLDDYILVTKDYQPALAQK